MRLRGVHGMPVARGTPVPSHTLPTDPCATARIPVLGLEPLEGSDSAPGKKSLRFDTPVLASALPPPADARGTVTLLSGIHAGRLAAIGVSPITMGRAVESDLVVDDPGVSRLHARIARAADGSFYAEDLGSTNGTYLRSDRIGVAFLQTGDLLQLGPNIRMRFAVIDFQEESLYRQLYDTSVHDPLTHVLNRKYLGDRLLVEISHARRTNGEVIVLMIDVDCLKNVNDGFGHLAGDRMLCAMAARIQSVLRVEDQLARYGGDEFVVLTVGTAGADASELAERIRRAVEGLKMAAGLREVGVTASIGVASFSEIEASGEPVGALLALADARMYAAKASGKNRVCTVQSALWARSGRHGGAR
jgi:diguanylate cyclase (GGDEF)-like protein